MIKYDYEPLLTQLTDLKKRVQEIEQLIAKVETVNVNVNEIKEILELTKNVFITDLISLKTNLTEQIDKAISNVNDYKTFESKMLNNEFLNKTINISTMQTSYKIQKGDTLTKIAKENNTTVDELLKLNPNIKNPNLIFAGSEIVISNGLNNNQTKEETIVNKEQKGSDNKEEVVKETTTPVKEETTDEDSKIIEQTNNNNSNNISNVQEIVDYAKQFIGTPYKYGTEGPNSFDCSGFTQVVFEHFGYSLPRTASEQRNVGVAVSKENLQPGDLVCFHDSSNNHVGIYVGDGKFIGAQSSTGVAITSLDNTYWSQRYVGARRLIN